MMAERKRRCRYQVWERGRGMRPYQCTHGARHERTLLVRAHIIDGHLVHASNQLLPVCGSHRNAYDRKPRPDAHHAYQWSETDGVYRPRVEEFV